MTAGSAGDATHVPAVTVDAKGRVTALSPVAITGLVPTLPGVATEYLNGTGAWTTPPDTGMTQLTGDATAGPGSGSQPLTLAASGVTPGSYGDSANVPIVVVDAKGRVTSLSTVPVTAGQSTVLNYTFSTGLTPPPPTGRLLLNQAYPWTNPGHLYVSVQTRDNLDVYWTLLLAPSGSRIVIQNTTDHTQYGEWTTTAAGVDNGTYVDFAVTTVSTGGSALSNNESVVLRLGSPAQATGNVSGPASSTTGDLASYADATGKVLADSGVPAAQVARTDQATTFTAGLGTTPLNASQLTSGTVPAAALPSDLAKTDAANVFTAFQTLSLTSPSLLLKDTSQPADQKNFFIENAAGQLYFIANNDAGTANSGVVSISRTGAIDAPGGLNASQLTTGTVPAAALPANVAKTDASNYFTANQVLQASNPVFYVVDTAQAANSKWWRNWSSAALLLFDALSDDLGTLYGRVAFSRGGNVAITGSFTEHSRSAPLGEWISAPPASYATDIGGPWTVPAASVLQSYYTLIGKTIIWHLVISGSTLGAPCNQLLIQLPSGIGPFYDMYAVQALLAYSADAGGFAVSHAGAYNGNTYYVGVAKCAGGQWAAGTITLYMSITGRLA